MILSRPVAFAAAVTAFFVIARGNHARASLHSGPRTDSNQPITVTGVVTSRYARSLSFHARASITSDESEESRAEQQHGRRFGNVCLVYDSQDGQVLQPLLESKPLSGSSQASGR